MIVATVPLEDDHRRLLVREERLAVEIQEAAAMGELPEAICERLAISGATYRRHAAETAPGGKGKVEPAVG